MKKALFILALVICLTFAACGDTAIDDQLPPAPNSTPDVSKPEDASGNVTNAADAGDDPAPEVIPYDQLQTDMYLSRETRTNGDGIVVTDIKYTYDSEGRVLSAIEADGSGYMYEYPDYSTEVEYHLTVGGKVYQKWVREYDGKHQLMSNLCYDADGKLIGDSLSYSNVYSEPNMISQIKYYTTDLEHYTTVDIEYSNGNVTKRTHKDENGDITEVQTYEFDEEGRTISSSDKNYADNWEFSERYEYTKDESGNTVSLLYQGDSETPSYKSIYNSDDKLIYDASYDENGNEESRTEVEIDGSREVTTTYLNGVIVSKNESVDGSYVRIENYDSEGKLSDYSTYEHTDTTMTERYYSVEDDLMLLTSKTIYTNGADGRPISMYSYDAEGNVTYSNVYTYDENNCLIKEETAWDSLSESSVVTYEYTKIEGVLRRIGDADNRG